MRPGLALILLGSIVFGLIELTNLNSNIPSYFLKRKFKFKKKEIKKKLDLK